MTLPDDVDVDAVPAAETDAVGGAARHAASRHLLALDSLVIDPVGRTAIRDGRVLRLLPKQFALLVYLLEHANQIVSRRSIARGVWGDETAMWTNVITVNVNGLRKEVEREGLPTLLHTVRGRGYLLGKLRE